MFNVSKIFMDTRMGDRLLRIRDIGFHYWTFIALISIVLHSIREVLTFVSYLLKIIELNTYTASHSDSAPLTLANQIISYSIQIVAPWSQ